MNKQSESECKGYSTVGLEEAIRDALDNSRQPFDNYEIVETFCHQEQEQETKYHVTLKTFCEC